MTETRVASDSDRVGAPNGTSQLVVHGTIDEVTRGASGSLSVVGQGSSFLN